MSRIDATVVGTYDGETHRHEVVFFNLGSNVVKL